MLQTFFFSMRRKLYKNEYLCCTNVLKFGFFQYWKRYSDGLIKKKYECYSLPPTNIVHTRNNILELINYLLILGFLLVRLGSPLPSVLLNSCSPFSNPNSRFVFSFHLVAKHMDFLISIHDRLSLVLLRRTSTIFVFLRTYRSSIPRFVFPRILLRCFSLVQIYPKDISF